jgi:glycerol-3-phosphate dehydrogenase subunit B
MTSDLPQLECDLLVIGTGMTGMAAALFAAQRGIDTVQVGMTGELNYASGLLDLMGVYPIDRGRRWENPWEAIDALIADCPRHPYALLDRADMRAAMGDLLTFLNDHGLPYSHRPEHNLQVITPIGTLKTTYAVQQSMYGAVKALHTKAPCLVVDFKGLKGFSATQVSQTLKAGWPDLRVCRLEFPDARPGDLYPEQMAQSLEVEANCVRLAEIIKPHLGDAEYVAVPAVLGLYRPRRAFENLQKHIGRKLFEIPIMPPSISGARLKNVFERDLPQLGVRTLHQRKVLQVLTSTSRGLSIAAGMEKSEMIIHAKGAILASGRFFGQGLHADRHHVRETIFDLNVSQPDSRDQWHRKDVLDVRGHKLNQAGIETDAHLRPLSAKGTVALDNVFAAGSILAHQDWVRMKCGSGLAITTAYAAVKHCAHLVLGMDAPED